MLVAKDLNGAIWRDADTLVYAVSPIYGRPGLFQLNCRSGHSRTVVRPTVIDKAYPHGADYFELVTLDTVKNQACFYYSAHVDQTDFTRLRAPQNLRCASLK
jgi:hypothetical protein